MDVLKVEHDDDIFILKFSGKLIKQIYILYNKGEKDMAKPKDYHHCSSALWTAYLTQNLPLLEYCIKHQTLKSITVIFNIVYVSYLLLKDCLNSFWYLFSDC